MIRRQLPKVLETDKLMELKCSIAEYRAGKVRGLKKVLDDPNKKHLGMPRHKPTRDPA
jgi:hypothetical protein